MIRVVESAEVAPSTYGWEIQARGLRVRVGDLRAFQTRQRAALRELTRIGEELGYDE